MISSIKNGIHVVGIDDAPHKRGDSSTDVFFTYCKGTFLENVSHTSITVDGEDSTQVILNELQQNLASFSLILLHGITVGGLNIVDINKISEELQKPIIAVTENPPTKDLIFEAISHLPNSTEKILFVEKAGNLFHYMTKQGETPISYHKCGIEDSLVIQFFEKFCIRSRLPEQLLLAHKIASAKKE